MVQPLKVRSSCVTRRTVEGDATIPTPVITCAVGVGKTAAAMELSILLETDGIAHSVVDLDALTMTFPRPADDPFGERLAVANLAAVWRNSAAVGAKNLMIARVIEQTSQLRGFDQAVPGAVVTLARLTADESDLQQRVRRREIGSATSWHEDRSLHLARALEAVDSDVVIGTTGRSVRNVASQLRAVVEWEH